MSAGLTGGGKGLIGLNRGSCGQWQWTHNLYCFSPFHIPVLFPCSPAFQSRSIVPWHWPQSMYDSSKLTNLPFASLNLSLLSGLWQSKHHPPGICFRTISWCISSFLGVLLAGISLWHCEHGNIPGEKGGGGTRNFFGTSCSADSTKEE